MRKTIGNWLPAAAALSVAAMPVQAQIAFGDDSSQWARDGECDDPRFVGDGMADILLEEDQWADATDCRALFDAGRIRLRDGDTSVPGGPIDFGADTGDWIFDGECDDPRFVGDGMAAVLLDEDRLADATDCRALYEAGRIRLRADGGKTLTRDRIRAVRIAAGVAEHGRLGPGDETLASGEFCDYFTFEGTAGAMAVVILRTSEFDPYLIVRSPGGEQIDNDDFEGDTGRSVVTFPMQEPGIYTVGVTSYEARETGAYSVLVEFQADAPAPAPGGERLPGELEVRAPQPGANGPDFAVIAAR